MGIQLTLGKGLLKLHFHWQSQRQGKHNHAIATFTESHLKALEPLLPRIVTEGKQADCLPDFQKLVRISVIFNEHL